MRRCRGFLARTAAAAMGMFLLAGPVLAQDDPLPSWNDGQAKKSIVAFVEKATTKDSPEFVPAEERIATFDNDGTLWASSPSTSSSCSRSIVSRRSRPSTRSGRTRSRSRRC